VPHAKTATIESHYFDFADRRLSQARLALRLRKAGGTWEQTVKGPGDGEVNRLEETVQRPEAGADDAPPVDLALHAGTSVGRLIDAAIDAKGLQAASLDAMFVTRVARQSAIVATDGSEVEVAFDRGSIDAGASTLPICEVEYELVSGDPELLFDLGRKGILQHGMWISVLNKAMRGDLLSSGRPTIPPAKSRDPVLTRKMKGAEIFQCALQACFEQVSVNASAVAGGQCDDEVIHQLRVGLRRLRTAGRELAPLNGGLPTPWESAVAQTFRVLGEYRDAATVASALRRLLSRAGSPEPMLSGREQQIPHPVAAVRSASFQLALLQVLASAHGRSMGVKDEVAALAPMLGAAESLKLIDARLDKLHARLKRDAKQFEKLEPLSQHRVRKRLKRLRYLTELVGSLYDTHQVERYLDRLRPAQDALGHHVDLAVGLGMARDASAAGDGKAWFNVGYLSAQLPMSTKDCAAALKRAARAKPYW
jgi:inorganic triphosphatase YgiF